MPQVSPSSSRPQSARPGLDAPVFIMGCPRSGTTLLYHMLVSTGEFVYYRAEVHAYSILGPKFGQFRSRRDRQLFLRHWLPTTYRTKTNLDAAALRNAILDECNSPGQFLAKIMEMMAHQQGIRRWAECTPANVFHLRQIQQEFPNAKFIHMVRDGRDVALSLARTKWISPFPWDRHRELSVAALFWQWNVGVGVSQSQSLGANYRECRYEDLVTNPEETLADLSEFLGEELDYDFIQANGVGSVRNPNTSFQDGKFHPVGRWRDRMTKEQVADVESVIGNMLTAKGYELSEHSRGAKPIHIARAAYKSLWHLKRWLRSHTVVGRLTDLDLLRANTKEPDITPVDSI